MVLNWVHSIHYFTIFNCRNLFFILANLPIIEIDQLKSIAYKNFCTIVRLWHRTCDIAMTNLKKESYISTTDNRQQKTIQNFINFEKWR
jgi:hypothetical protein